MANSSALREYLVFRIADLQREVQEMSLDNGAALAIEFARIEENKNALAVLNGGKVPVFKVEEA